jgi:hypothetical protein
MSFPISVGICFFIALICSTFAINPPLLCRFWTGELYNSGVSNILPAVRVTRGVKAISPGRTGALDSEMGSRALFGFLPAPPPYVRLFPRPGLSVGAQSGSWDFSKPGRLREFVVTAEPVCRGGAFFERATEEVRASLLNRRCLSSSFRSVAIRDDIGRSNRLQRETLHGWSSARIICYINILYNQIGCNQCDKVVSKGCTKSCVEVLMLKSKLGVDKHSRPWRGGTSTRSRAINHELSPF